MRNFRAFMSRLAITAGLCASAAATPAIAQSGQELAKACAELDLQLLMRLDDSRLDDRWPAAIRAAANAHRMEARIHCHANEAAPAFARFELALALLGEPWLAHRMAMSEPRR